MSPVSTTRKRQMVPALAAMALAVAGVAAGCGGGGSGGTPSTPTPDPSSLAAAAAPAGLSAADAIAALGTLAAPDQSTVLSSVGRYDRFGAMRDPFKPVVIASPTTTPTTPIPGVIPTTGTGGVVVPPVTGLPLIPGVIPGTTGGTGGTTTPGTTTGGTTTPVASPNPLEADIDVSGEPLVAREGDAIPPDSQEFRVERLTTKAMTLKLTAGILPDGTDTFTLRVGRRVTLYDQGERRTYRLRLNAVRRVR